jgi:hypothetical protein
VSSPSDPAEREANAVAQRFVSAGAPPLPPPASPTLPPPPRQAPRGARLLPVAPDFAARLDAERKDGGKPLPANLRFDFQRHLGGGALDGVRLHTGAKASSLASAARARAFTVGRDIFFREGHYQPASGGGRRLIAHEVAHALQPAAPAGAAPVLSRAPDDDERAAAAPDAHAAARRRQAESDLDDLSATLVKIMNAPELVASGDTDLLLASGDPLQRHFEQPGMPRTQKAAARALLALFRELSRRAQAAPRGPEGELLRRDSFGREMIAWTKDKPHALADIPPFSSDNVSAWNEAVTAPEAPERRAPRAAAPLAPTRVRARPPRPGAAPGDRGGPEARPGDVIDVTSLLEAVASDKNETPAGSPEIRAGVDKLRQFSVKQLVEGVAAPQPGPDAPVAHANLPEQAGESVFASAGLLIYVSASRVFLLDRGGRVTEAGGLASDLGLEPSKANFRLKGFSFTPGGVYFVSKFQLSSRGGHGGERRVVTVRVDQGGRIDEGDIFLQQTNEGLLRVLPMEQEVIRSGAGIGVIVSPHLGEPISNSASNVRRALDGIPDHLVFELEQQAKAMLKDPGALATQTLVGEAKAEIQSLITELGDLEMAFGALIDVGWFADVSSIAAQARSDDEIDIAAQLFARRLAAEIIGRHIARAIGLGKAVARKVIGRIGRRGKQGGKQQGDEGRQRQQGEDDTRRQRDEEARRQREEEDRRQAEVEAERREQERQAQERLAQERRDREERARAANEPEEAPGGRKPAGPEAAPEPVPEQPKKPAEPEAPEPEAAKRKQEKEEEGEGDVETAGPARRRTRAELDAELQRLRKIDDPAELEQSLKRDKAFIERAAANEKLLADEPRLTKDLAEAQVTMERFKRMREGDPALGGERLPLAFPSAEVYAQFKQEFAALIAKTKVEGKPISAQAQNIGSSAGFYSGNPDKPSGHHFSGASDVDIDLFSPELVEHMLNQKTALNPKSTVRGEKTIFRNVLGDGEGSGFFQQFSDFREFAVTWQGKLGREVNIKLKAELTPISSVPKPGHDGPIEFFRQEAK